MKVFAKIKEAEAYVQSVKKSSLTIGFVPTMGALHAGHLSLIETAAKENDIVIASIFINPMQFNSKEDFEKYPVQNSRDIEMLEQSKCDMVFIPDVDEMYPRPVSDKYDFDILDKVMEGAFRPGHFNGVAIVVKRLLEIAKPDKAYFGEKDYQQLQIIKHLVKLCHIPVEIVPCPIVREADGLAMSSRNMRLTPEERKLAPIIYQTLQKCALMADHHTVEEVKSFYLSEILQTEGFQPDYFEIADETSLQPIKNWNDSKNLRAFVAVYLGNIRLIDNLKIIL